MAVRLQRVRLAHTEKCEKHPPPPALGLDGKLQTVAPEAIPVEQIHGVEVAAVDVALLINAAHPGYSRSHQRGPAGRQQQHGLLVPET